MNKKNSTKLTGKKSKFSTNQRSQAGRLHHDGNLDSEKFQNRPRNPKNKPKFFIKKVPKTDPKNSKKSYLPFLQSRIRQATGTNNPQTTQKQLKETNLHLIFFGREKHLHNESFSKNRAQLKLLSRKIDQLSSQIKREKKSKIEFLPEARKLFLRRKQLIDNRTKPNLSQILQKSTLEGELEGIGAVRALNEECDLSEESKLFERVTGKQRRYWASWSHPGKVDKDYKLNSKISATLSNFRKIKKINLIERKRARSQPLDYSSFQIMAMSTANQFFCRKIEDSKIVQQSKFLKKWKKNMTIEEYLLQFDQRSNPMDPFYRHLKSKTNPKVQKSKIEKLAKTRDIELEKSSLSLRRRLGKTGLRFRQHQDFRKTFSRNTTKNQWRVKIDHKQAKDIKKGLRGGKGWLNVSGDLQNLSKRWNKKSAQNEAESDQSSPSLSFMTNRGLNLEEEIYFLNLKCNQGKIRKSMMFSSESSFQGASPSPALPRGSIRYLNDFHDPEKQKQFSVKNVENLLKKRLKRYAQITESQAMFKTVNQFSISSENASGTSERYTSSKPSKYANLSFRDSMMDNLSRGEAHSDLEQLSARYNANSPLNKLKIKKYDFSSPERSEGDTSRKSQSDKELLAMIGGNFYKNVQN